MSKRLECGVSPLTDCQDFMMPINKDTISYKHQESISVSGYQGRRASVSGYWGRSILVSW